jgi:4-hydroxythreonine-4-phosphate dehydrogenase
MDEKIKIGISIGDYNGIGAEVILKTLDDERMAKMANFVIYGHRSVLNHYAKILQLGHVQILDYKHEDKHNPKVLQVIPCWTDQVEVKPSEATDDAGAKALLALNAAADDLIAGHIDVLVTAPLNKQTVSKQLPDFRGQTEFIATKAGSENPMMMLVAERLKIGLVSGHVSLKEVPAKMEMLQIISKIEALHKTLKQDFLIDKPRIAVLGLNPHSGDNGLLGKEEKEIIAPSVIKARDKGILVMGPYSADGFFGAGSYLHFDAVLAMYHDQGLIPFKTIAFDTGVNFTASTGVIRTSPDHGTGYDIAGQGKANPDSMRAAIYLGIDIYQHRQTYKEMTANPLERVRLEYGEE